MADIGISQVPITQESVRFNQPMASSSTSAIAGVCNALLRIFLPVGSIVQSILTEADFQAELGNPSPETWVLADGRNVAGSTYTVVTGNSTIPDLRGVFLRGKNNGRSDGNQNPDGDLPLGTLTSFKTAAHTHQYFATQQPLINDGNIRTESRIDGAIPYNTTAFTSTTGANESAPKNTTLNTFIRIN